MNSWLPLVLFLVFLLLLAAMPWRRPHPNHVFILEFYRRVLGSQPLGPALTLNSSACNRAVTTPRYKQASR